MILNGVELKEDPEPPPPSTTTVEDALQTLKQQTHHPIIYLCKCSTTEEKNNLRLKNRSNKTASPVVS